MVGKTRSTTSLEPIFWHVLERIAETRGIDLLALVWEIDRSREADRSLASVLREHAMASILETRAP